MKAPLAIAFCAMGESGDLFAVGDRVVEQAPAAAHWMSRVLRALSPAEAVVYVDRPWLASVLNSAARPQLRMEVLSRRRTGLSASLWKRRNGPVLFLNPFFLHLEPDALKSAADRLRDEEKLLLSVRHPFSHPIRIRRPWTCGKKGVPPYMAYVHTNHWYLGSTDFTFRGRTYPNCRQCYPEVVEVCGAAAGIPAGMTYREVDRRFLAGRFERLPLDGTSRFNTSITREYLMALVSMRGEDEAASVRKTPLARRARNRIPREVPRISPEERP